MNYPPPENKSPDVVISVQTTAETAHLYRYVASFICQQSFKKGVVQSNARVVLMVITIPFMRPQNQARRWDLVV